MPKLRKTRKVPVLKYSDKMDPSDQIDAEEMIAATIFDFEGGLSTEEGCSELGRTILRGVLIKFRPDLLEKCEHERVGGRMKAGDIVVATCVIIDVDEDGCHYIHALPGTRGVVLDDDGIDPHWLFVNWEPEGYGTCNITRAEYEKYRGRVQCAID